MNAIFEGSPKSTGPLDPSHGALPSHIAPAQYLQTLWTHLTKEMCQEVFELIRDTERQRKWTLYALLQMWLGLLQTRLLSQTQAVEECGQGNPFFPDVKATAESFFQRVQTLRPRFFHAVFSRFTQAIQPHLPKTFCQSLAQTLPHFPEIVVLDASRLHKVAHLLKATRTVTEALLPGTLEAIYDLKGGVLQDLLFDPDGHRGEKHLIAGALDTLQKGTLILHDRQAGLPVYWKEVQRRGLWMIARHTERVKTHCLKVLEKTRSSTGALDDLLVELGTDKVVVRFLRWKTHKGTLTLLTNVLEPHLLSAGKALGLYRERWSIERMFLHLKDTLQLNRLFNASPTAVGQQVYATAILYNALRLSQAQMAQSLDLPPERLSPEKLFPRVMDKVVRLTSMESGAELMYMLLKLKSPHPLERPDLQLGLHPSLALSVRGLLVEKRSGRRWKPKFCPGRHQHKSFKQIPGARKYAQF